tara:strand:+ start:347 stop:937 length:591 start_codon:yes stop_codon:yes gene_type:complete
MKSLVYGVGINDFKLKTANGVKSKDLYACHFYRTWSNMIRRCYSENFHKIKPSYKECTVCDEWLLFSSFKKWMSSQDWTGKQLDKDIINAGNKIYSKDNCMFVSREINSLLVDHKNRRGKYSKGVSLCIHSGSFRATCGVYGKVTHVGYFKEERDAKKAYNEFKSLHVRRIAKENIANDQLYSALIRRADLILKGE